MAKNYTSRDFMDDTQTEIKRLEIREMCTDDKTERAQIRRRREQRKRLLSNLQRLCGTYRKTVKYPYV